MEDWMRIRWLGWAGVEIEEHGERLLIDPLQDPGAMLAWMGDKAARIPLPKVAAPEPGAVAGLLTHLHRDHADAAALTASLAPEAPVYEPDGYGGAGVEQLAIAQADHELTAAGLTRHRVNPWTTRTIGPFTVTALPAVDGTGDPQVSWLIEAQGKHVLHLGDTMFHGWWWRFRERFGAPDLVLAPINGARVSLPHRTPASPLPAAMDPEQAALAAELLGADRLGAIHYDGYALPGLYEPVPDALEQLNARSDRLTALKIGATLDI
jgi:L-ascorbate metabolism protein UlaG (beta-lactamase superfamily)